ncbi:hypothetical protein [Amycolatopsis sp. EV170708-02-1]|uniref:hypothetical protein n=1 Tax=Amycolatopsis sp. EV170708-02-1 TaxID=2919322 RepID=UPI001F0C5405|nr:hypothetical protein [Amycolatopsis sp. EV170708-02-1]UMP06272.1 hypothetical protein MJQ72_16300 [Amycolatopsis sp. EV170708-02-1]
MKLRRASLLSLVAAVATIMLVAPTSALAAPPTSAVEVSPTTVQRGQTFTVTQTVYNADATSTIEGGKATLYGKESSLPGIVDLVSCPGAFACDVLGGSIRGGVGTVPPGQSKTVVFTLRVKDDAPLGDVTLQHQFVGDNYSFEILDGPVLTISGTPSAADLGVTLTASPRGILTSSIDYTVKVTNAGPAAASGIRVASTLGNGLRFTGSSVCSNPSGTKVVNCDFSSLASGASATAKFTVAAGLLSVGPVKTTAKITQSSAADPNAANDTASSTCTAITGLLLTC